MKTKQNRRRTLHLTIAKARKEAFLNGIQIGKRVSKRELMHAYTRVIEELQAKLVKSQVPEYEFI